MRTRTQPVEDNKVVRLSRVPVGETKPEAFVRLATRRTRQVLRGLERLGKLEQRHGNYSSAQIEEMLTAVNEAVEKLRARFAAKMQPETEFEFRTTPPNHA